MKAHLRAGLLALAFALAAAAPAPERRLPGALPQPLPEGLPLAAQMLVPQTFELGWRDRDTGELVFYHPRPLQFRPLYWRLGDAMVTVRVRELYRCGAGTPFCHGGYTYRSVYYYTFDCHARPGPTASVAAVQRRVCAKPRQPQRPPATTPAEDRA